MKDDRYTEELVAEGEEELQTLKAALAAEGISGIPPEPLEDDNGRQYFSSDNMRSLIVHPKNGGWVADILLRRPLPGGGDILGTPDANPFHSRAAALAAGQDMVKNYMLLAQMSFVVGDRGYVVTSANGCTRLYTRSLRQPGTSSSHSVGNRRLRRAWARFRRGRAG